MKVTNFTEDVFAKPYSFINDYYSMAAFAKLQPYKISHALSHKTDLIERYVIANKRTVYKSLGSLAYVQKNLRRNVFAPLQLEPEFDHMWAYKKGCNVREKITEIQGAKWLVHFDIKKYFDTINFAHIVETLQFFGFTYRGAKLVARSTTVKRNGRSTLQQGSAVSGELSNLVGHYYFDRHLLQKLEARHKEHPGMTYKYRRYCDNVYLALWGEIDIAVIGDYCTTAKKLAEKSRFKTHKWAIVPHNHPKRNMKALGMVINAEARIERDQFEAVRATLFNACRFGINNAAYKYMEFQGEAMVSICRWYPEVNIIREKFLQIIRGKISYINSISTKQGLQLQKLYNAAMKLDQVPPARRLTSRGYLSEDQATLRPEIFEAVKTYTKREESLAEYDEKLTTVVGGLTN